MLLLQGVDEQTVMAVMGWSDRRMVQRYQHVIDELRVEASKRLGALLWGDDKPKKRKKKAKAKRSKEATRRKLDRGSTSSATDHATEGKLAKVIPLHRSA